MKLRTELNIPKSDSPINYDSKIVLYGSCFTNNIENYFNHFKFQNKVNSHGILFQPKAIEEAIYECIKKKKYDKSQLENYNDLWMSMNHHSSFSSTEQKEALRLINNKIIATHEVLKSASHIVITLGTSWVYTYKKTNSVVANCHRIPQKEFNKKLLGIEEITKSLDRIKSMIHQFNSDANIIFTVSPVRHIKDGLIQNSLSKAHLLAAIHQVIDTSKTFYFPSYEIMMDDLRDYRFYKSDLIHPNKTAIEYIWEIFKQTWIDEKTYNLMDQVDEIQKSLQHKPFHKESNQHKLFLKKLKTKIESLAKKIPHIEFNKMY